MATIFKRFYTVVGNVTLDHVRQQNANGAHWAEILDTATKREEIAASKMLGYNPAFTKLRILRGARAHKSHSDPDETQYVISARLLTERETRIKSLHVREDGTVKPSK
ncbi:uncharacterized protein N7518_007832 [Penicillium psychrosexuale]|uniref:uncharacterized protein n=1 Tax=Penicillium psychrosexuale TaxID=1002107 RepID=UPI0025452854|nr:uncharacterized protein N7518_007832 [Penicillium psychrosexuale]KAJ5790821.1 hypothetical protein N7518_007832 [Penicillium psychrosexuale]